MVHLFVLYEELVGDFTCKHFYGVLARAEVHLGVNLLEPFAGDLNELSFSFIFIASDKVSAKCFLDFESAGSSHLERVCKWFLLVLDVKVNKS